MTRFDAKKLKGFIKQLTDLPFIAAFY